MATVTNGVTTTGFTIEVPDIRMRSVRVVGDQLELETDQIATNVPESPFFGQLLVKGLMRSEVNISLRRVIDRLTTQTRVLDESCLHDFLNMSHASDVAGFVHKYGPLVPCPPNSNKMPMWFALQQRDRLSILVWMGQAINSANPEDIKEALKDATAAGLDFTEDPLTCLSAHLSQWLALAQPILKPAINRLQPAFLCSPLLAGLYALVLVAIEEGSPWSRCSNGSCRKLFRVVRPGKRFCSEACQQAWKQRRYRNERKSRNAISDSTEGTKSKVKVSKKRSKAQTQKTDKRRK
jgi:hypothetical protein